MKLQLNGESARQTW